jgi:hypothetical protein
MTAIGFTFGILFSIFVTVVLVAIWHDWRVHDDDTDNDQ